MVCFGEKKVYRTVDSFDTVRESLSWFYSALSHGKWPAKACYGRLAQYLHFIFLQNIQVSVFVCFFSRFSLFFSLQFPFYGVPLSVICKPAHPCNNPYWSLNYYSFIADYWFHMTIMGTLEAGSNSARADNSICRRFGHIRVSRIVFLLCFLLLLLPFITHYYLSKVCNFFYNFHQIWINTQGKSCLNCSSQVESGSQTGDTHHVRFKLESLEDLGALKASDLRLRIQEMERIKGVLFSHFNIPICSLLLPLFVMNDKGFYHFV